MNHPNWKAKLPISSERQKCIDELIALAKRHAELGHIETAAAIAIATVHLKRHGRDWPVRGVDDV